MASRQSTRRTALLASLPTLGGTVALMLFATVARAAVIEADSSNYQSLVTSLAPGDTLRLAPGTYSQGLSLARVTGTATRPITVTGPDDQSAVFPARDCCNTVQLDDTSFLRVMNLTLDGGGRVGPSGVGARGNSHDITLENLKIVGHNGSANTAAISTEGSASNWIIRHDVIIGAGTGLRLGSSDGTQTFVAGLIEHNVLLDTLGPDMELAPRLAPSALIELPGRPARTIIRYNVVSKPGIALGSDDEARPAGANELYTTYGNLLYSSSSPSESGTDSRSIKALASTAAATPTLMLSASPSVVAAGGSSTLSWTSTGADGCSASGGWMGTKAPNGSATVGPIQSTTSFQLTCLGAGGNASQIVQVSVGDTSPPTTTPPPETPPSTTTPPATGDSGSGGGGSLDAMMIGLLILSASWKALTRARSLDDVAHRNNRCIQGCYNH